MKEFPDTEVTENQVYAMWLSENEQAWKLDADQVVSAQKLVEREAGKEVELIALREEPGTAAIAFALKEPMKEWAHETAEIAFDGTCKRTSGSGPTTTYRHPPSLTVNTNAAGYELSALVAEGNGQAIPLGFIFTTSTDGTATTGAKHRLLVDFFNYFKARCPNIKFTLSDKERAEISAFREVWNQAKHNCCYWHAIHYLEIRLAEDKAPAAYDPIAAHHRHDFIDPTWAPGVSASPEDAEHELNSGGAVNHAKKVEENAEAVEAVRLARRSEP